MSKHIYPSFTIDHLAASKLPSQLLNADRFKGYLLSNPHLQVVHSHSFYHIVYFTQGSGSHTIDFETFPVKKGMIYFMRPGQVHNWHFTSETDGYIVNFSPTFFDQLYIASHFMEQFSFLEGHAASQVIALQKSHRQIVETFFEQIITEQASGQTAAPLMIGSLLIQLFITISRMAPVSNLANSTSSHQSVTLKKFQQLIEINFRQIKLPKEYAALLFVTPSHLNALCKEQFGLPAGDIIRNRIVLEAKRLLVNFNLSIGDIASELNFPDTSYFVKFFKKYTGITPDGFRTQHYKS